MGFRYLFVAQYLWSSLPGSSLVLNFFCGRQRRYASVFQMWRGLRFGAFDARGLEDAGCILWNARRALRVLLGREWAFRAAGRRLRRSRIARIICCGG